MRLSPKTSFLLLLCLVLMGLSPASCGGKPSVASSTTDMTVSVAEVNKSIFSFPFYVAQQENFVKDQGLTLDPSSVLLLGSGSKLAAAIESNSVDLAIGGITDVFALSKIDTHMRVIGSVTNGYLEDVVVSKRFEQQVHLTSASPLANKVKALVGEKVGISAPNSATDALLTYLVRQQGLDAQKDVTKVNLGAAIPTALASLQTNRVDAVVVSAPAGVEAEVQGIGERFISPVRGDVPGMQGQLFGVAYAKQSMITSKPKAVQAFIRALAQAETFMQKHPDQAEALLGKYLNLDQTELKLAWSQVQASMSTTPQLSQQSYAVANQFHLKAGLIAATFPYNNLVATDTINQALSGLSGSS